MKKCPKCGIEFDAGFTLCPRDGTRLNSVVHVEAAPMEQKTVSAHRPIENETNDQTRTTASKFFDESNSNLSSVGSPLHKQGQAVWMVLSAFLGVLLVTVVILTRSSHRENSPEATRRVVEPVSSSDDDVVESEAARTPEAASSANEIAVSGYAFNIAASSIKKSQQTPVTPNLAYDGRRDTSWCEGASNDGVGESLEFHFVDHASHLVSRVEIVPGYDKYKADKFGDRWLLNNRALIVRVEGEGGQVARTTLDPNDRSFQRLTLPSDFRTSYVRLVFESVVRGTATTDNDLCISEVQVYESR